MSEIVDISPTHMSVVERDEAIDFIKLVSVLNVTTDEMSAVAVMRQLELSKNTSYNMVNVK